MCKFFSQKRVLLYGARSNPLSYFLTRQLNVLLNARNVFIADTSETMGQNRMPSDRKFSCNELIVDDQHKLINQIEQHQISNVIDLTNGTLLEDRRVKLEKQLPKVNIFTPVFAGLYQKALVAPTTEKRQVINPENLSEDAPLSEEEFEAFEKRRINEHPGMVLPNIVYPLQLSSYRLPCDLGSYIFWNSFRKASLTLDCSLIGIPNSEKLLNLCSYRDAVECIIAKGLASKK